MHLQVQLRPYPSPILRATLLWELYHTLVVATYAASSIDQHRSFWRSDAIQTACRSNRLMSLFGRVCRYESHALAVLRLEVNNFCSAIQYVVQYTRSLILRLEVQNYSSYLNDPSS